LDHKNEHTNGKDTDQSGQIAFQYVSIYDLHSASCLYNSQDTYCHQK